VQGDPVGRVKGGRPQRRPPIPRATGLDRRTHNIHHAPAAPS
jgi:hypothetical protein